MNRRNRKMLLNLATGVAVTATAVVVFLPAAQAAPGTITSNVNVRSGPGTNYGVVDTVRSGTQVDVQQCEGSFCYITKSGPDGWVSSTYIDRGRGGSSNPSVGITIGSDGRPQININRGDQDSGRDRDRGRPDRWDGDRGGRGPDRGRPDRNDSAEVCFFDRANFRGQSTCLSSGDSVSNLRGWADRISSIENPDGLNVQVCGEAGYRDCRTYSTSSSSLGAFDDYIVSVRVR